jgi:hypothetical protein
VIAYSDYARDLGSPLEFRIIVASTKWNESALVTVFRSRLLEEVQMDVSLP